VPAELASEVETIRDQIIAGDLETTLGG